MIAGGHCTYNPEPLAEYVDAFVIGDGEEVVGEIAEVVGAWKRGGRAIARSGAARPRDDLRRLRAVDVRRRVRRAGARVRSRPAYPDVPADRRQAHGRRPRRVAVPEEPARAARRGRARPVERRDLPRLHARLPVLPGGDDHPAGAGTARGAGAHDGARGPAPHRLRRGRAHVAVERRLLGDRRRGRRPRQRSGRHGRGERVAAVACASTRSRVGHRERDPEGAPHRAHVRARGRVVAAAPGDQQAHRRRRPVLRGRRRVLAGLAAGEALLPHRPADRDGRRHARHRASWQRNVVDIGRKYTKQASCTVSVGGFVPKPHTPFQWFGQNGVDELQRKITLLRNAVQGHALRSSSGTIPRRRSRRASRRAATGGSAG